MVHLRAWIKVYSFLGGFLSSLVNSDGVSKYSLRINYKLWNFINFEAKPLEMFDTLFFAPCTLKLNGYMCILHIAKVCWSDEKMLKKLLFLA